MATKIDYTAEKQRKQKIILAVLGVGLVGVLALQGPKLLDQVRGSSAKPAPSATASGSGGTSATGTSSGGTSASTAAAGPTALLVGVNVGTGARPLPGPGQLKTFTLFEAKDPFVQQLPTVTNGTTSSSGGSATGAAEPGAGAGAGAGAAGAGGSSTTASPVALGFATISVNGDSQTVGVKKLFPRVEKVFVLVSLTPKSAKIAVAGGSFTDSQTVTLQLGKNLTLLNTATGARYSLKLLYTGDAPERVAGFTQKK